MQHKQLTVYFISGLGADQRIFKNLQLLPALKVKHIHWIDPLQRESLKDYCHRLSKQVDPSDEIIYLGLSFGGIVAIELDKLIPSKLVILISTISIKNELPFSFRLIKTLGLHKLMPASFYKWHNKFINWYFGAKTSEEKCLLHSFLQSVSKVYMKWSVDQVLNWNNEQRSANIFQLHGTADRIFPCRKSLADIKIKNGSHFMTFNMAEELSFYINRQIHFIFY